ncbi:helix-turn-helix transcriptional regulator [Flavobacteriaceae bacterium TP-CH-4]|uniref:Helix-turn-helix transcriptional regulator n=1 Tax=Pelagihabitans pacificus TaxID=2696054 RepID=A0A967E7J6_9FLAO|nr:AraC family transcriptional regulator [Pelagihabitans pacificus]NHF60705.1 helix-turn-helix transcriptional regulator [Pelagihabitans pacificus]
MKVVPQAFYQHPHIEKVMVDGLSCILLKSVRHTDVQNQRYLSAHALTLVLNGSLRIESFEGNLQIVRKNQLIFLPKGLYMISDIIPKDQAFEAVVFFFDEEVTDTFLEKNPPFKNGKEIETIVIDYNEELRLFTDTLLTLYRGRKQHQFTKAKLVELLHFVASSSKGKDFRAQLQSLKIRGRKKIRAFMEEHFDKPLDIEDYAYLTGRSISTFQRDFKRRFQISPKKWLIDKRLKKAAKLLREPSVSVNEITLEAGYGNTSHFIKAFRKKFGTSPKQYQIQHRENTFI